MYNEGLVSSFLREKGRYPEPENGEEGLRLSLDRRRLLLQGSPADLIDLADLLVALALSGEERGQHWHIDELTLMDPASEIPELILARK